MAEAQQNTGQAAPAEFASEPGLEAIYDIPVEITVVLGRASISIQELLQMNSGTVIELERKVGEPVEVFVNNRLVARGEVIIVEDRIGITLTEIIKADKNEN